MNKDNSIYTIRIALDDNDSAKGSILVPMKRDLYDQFIDYMADLEVERQESTTRADDSNWCHVVYRELIEEMGLPRAVNVFSSNAMNKFHQALIAPLPQLPRRKH